MKFNLMDLKAILSAIDFNINVLTNEEQENNENDYIKKLKYARNEIKKEIDILTTTRYDYEL